MDSWMNFAREMGLGVTLAIATFAAFFFLLKWVLKASEKMLERMHEQELRAWATMEGYQKALQEHTAQAKEFHNTVQEAYRFQREEHKQMIDTLGRINGYKNG